MADIMKMGKNPNYLGSWDLEELPKKEIVLTIEEIKDEEVVADGRKEVCTVCHWTDKKYKPMILNVCNKKAIAKVHKTTDTERLKGKSVVIGIEKVKAFGDIHDALRIRKRMPAKTDEIVQKCENCGKDIAAAYGMTITEMAAYTKTKYGKALCEECAKKLAEEKSKESESVEDDNV